MTAELSSNEKQESVQINSVDLYVSQKNGEIPFFVGNHIREKIQGRVYEILKNDSNCPQQVFLKVKEDVFVPTKTANLFMRNIEIKKDDTVVDIGCGSGILGIVAQAKGAKKIIGVDVNEEGLKLSEENAGLNDINDAEFLTPDMFSEKYGQTKIADVVIANLPQVPGKFGCGSDGTAHILNYLEDIPNYLKKNGKIYIMSVSYSNPSYIENISSKKYDVKILEEDYIPIPNYLDLENNQKLVEDKKSIVYKKNIENGNFEEINHLPESHKGIYAKHTLYEFSPKVVLKISQQDDLEFQKSNVEDELEMAV